MFITNKHNVNEQPGEEASMSARLREVTLTTTSARRWERNRRTCTSSSGGCLCTGSRVPLVKTVTEGNRAGFRFFKVEVVLP